VLRFILTRTFTPRRVVLYRTRSPRRTRLSRSSRHFAFAPAHTLPDIFIYSGSPDYVSTTPHAPLRSYRWLCTAVERYLRARSTHSAFYGLTTYLPLPLLLLIAHLPPPFSITVALPGLPTEHLRMVVRITVTVPRLDDDCRSTRVRVSRRRVTADVALFCCRTLEGRRTLTGIPLFCSLSRQYATASFVRHQPVLARALHTVPHQDACRVRALLPKTCRPLPCCAHLCCPPHRCHRVHLPIRAGRVILLYTSSRVRAHPGPPACQWLVRHVGTCPACPGSLFTASLGGLDHLRHSRVCVQVSRSTHCAPALPATQPICCVPSSLLLPSRACATFSVAAWIEPFWSVLPPVPALRWNWTHAVPLHWMPNAQERELRERAGWLLIWTGCYLPAALPSYHRAIPYRLPGRRQA